MLPSIEQSEESEKGRVVDDRLLRVRQVAVLLNVSNTAVYRLVERREIPFYRFTRKLRFRTSDVEEFLRSTRVEQIGDARLK